MTAVMLVIVIVEITCQEEKGEEVKRGERGSVTRVEGGGWGGGGRPGHPDDFSADNQPARPVG